jgi:hypothetical protein
LEFGFVKADNRDGILAWNIAHRIVHGTEQRVSRDRRLGMDRRLGIRDKQ